MEATLNAWTVTHYGGPEVLAPVTKPVPAPGTNDVVIRIRASAVSRADGLMRAGRPLFARAFLGLRRPRNGLSGTCFSGEVIATGHAVTRFGTGDEVFGEAGLHFGANATHIRLGETETLMPKPPTLSHEEAAVMCDGPLTSWHFLNVVADLKPGQRVLILAGAGSLGSAAIQIASAMGAHVTATGSTRNLDLMTSLGADAVIDYTTTDPLAPGAGHDVIFDTIGVASFRAARAALTESGRYICPVLGLGLLRDMALSRLSGRKRASFAAAGLEKPDLLRRHLSALLDLIEDGRFAPLMDRTYPLSDLVEAHRYVATGHKRGNVVVV